MAYIGKTTKEYLREYRLKNREKVLAKEREYHANNREIRNEQRSAHYEKNKVYYKEQFRVAHSKRKFGEYSPAHLITLQITEAILGHPITRNNKRKIS